MSNMGRRTFVLFNKFFMVPMFRLGFGPFMGNRVTGYIMVLRTVGRKSRKVRYSPVSYAIHRGNVYCMAGFGHISDWYRNIQAAKEVEVMLPSAAIYGRVEEVEDPTERKLILRMILKNAGFAGFFEGFNPVTVTDEELLQKTVGLPLLRIHPIGVGNGPSDPGGWMRVWTALSIIVPLALVIWLIVR
ncbi:MAG: nitroreductase family deazaflavin-dependent oxidoreductase [Chloroflexi bacterium]|nr:nitroreductase family deazaflavin-dependent oxidoreductase [Chloroflexota bacterium]